MKLVRSTVWGVLLLGLAVMTTPTAATAGGAKVMPGQSIQDAVDAALPGDTITVYPGDYTETHGGTAAVRITKPLKLKAKLSAADRQAGLKVRILPGAGNLDGVLVEPENPGDPDIDGFQMKGFTVEGFPNNGIFLRHVNNFKLMNNESKNNLENGIWPTLSANGLVKKNVSYGSEDSALWVEASTNVRVLQNELYASPTGLEITVSKDIQAKKNDIHDNTVGVGLYHPSAAGLPPLGGDGYWEISSNDIHDNNAENTAPGGSMSAGLPSGGGVLVLGVDHADVVKNTITNNNFYGISVIDYCVAVAGTDFDCTANPPDVESAPDTNTFVSNVLTNNGTAPAGECHVSGDVCLSDADCDTGSSEVCDLHPLAPYAADITYIMLETGHFNCFAKNEYTTYEQPGFGPAFLNSCN